MRTFLRTIFIPSALAAVAAAQASVSLYYALDSAPTVPLSALPLISTSTSLSVYFTSTTAINDAEVFLGYDRANVQGIGATPLDNKVSLTGASPASSSIVFNGGTRLAGGFGASTASPKPYGIDIMDASGTGGVLTTAPTSGPVKLLSVTLNNLALTTGQSTTLSFNVPGTPSTTPFQTDFFDNGGSVQVTATSLMVTAAPVPEPASFAALGLGALAMLRRRKRA